MMPGLRGVHEPKNYGSARPSNYKARARLGSTSHISELARARLASLKILEKLGFNNLLKPCRKLELQHIYTQLKVRFMFIGQITFTSSPDNILKTNK